LDAIIREVGPLPLRLARAILAQVADALGYAHRHGVIHRDIKSANIMLDEEGWAVVTDFGIAKVVQAEGLTVTGVTVGTPTYMSPEQCDNRELTGASDQYSLGVVGYEMLTGKVPFQGDSVMAVMYAHFNQRPRPLTELEPDCAVEAAAAMHRCRGSSWPPRSRAVLGAGSGGHGRCPLVGIGAARVAAATEGGAAIRCGPRHLCPRPRPRPR